MSALQTNSSQLQDLEDRRPQSPPGHMLIPGLAWCSCHFHGHSAAWWAKTIIWGCPTGLASVARLRDRFQRPETGTSQEGARKKWHDRSCTLSASLPAQGTGCSVAVSGREDGMCIAESEGLRNAPLARMESSLFWDERTVPVCTWTRPPGLREMYLLFREIVQNSSRKIICFLWKI